MTPKALFLSVFLILGAIASAQTLATDGSLSFQSPSPKGAVLLLHGFNVKPTKMDTLAKIIASWGYTVYRPALSGHKGVWGEFNRASPFHWIDETWNALQIASALTEGKVPVYFVSISMGGLLLNQVLEKYPEARSLVKKSVLISPAFNFTFYARSPRYLILHDSFPLFARDREWDVSSVTLGMFRGLLDLYYEAHETKFVRMNIPSLIFLHPQDKVIDAVSTYEMKRELGMTQWEFVWLPTTLAPIGNSNKHLLVDQNTAGPHVWRTLLEETKTFLDK